MAKAEEAKKEGEGEAPKKGSKKLLVIIALVVVVLLGGGGAAMALMGGEKKEEIKKEEVAPPVLKLAKMEAFLVNLSEQSSFLKAVILIEYDETILHRVLAAQTAGGGSGHGGGAGGGGGGGGDPHALPRGMAEKEPMLRDAIIRVFVSKKSAEVLSGEGKDRLKEELVEGINEALAFDEPVVTNIYFTEFIVQ
jgi:flagellar FliL protein